MHAIPLSPILQRSASADGLKCKTLQKSGSCGLITPSGRAVADGCRLAERHRLKAPPGEAWSKLSTSLIDAFGICSDVSPDHPVAAIMMAICSDLRALARDLASQECWADGAYTRTTVLKGEGFEAMLLCWPANVCSPIHSHSDATSGAKSNCFMVVLEGELTETAYPPSEVVDAKVVGAGQTRSLPAGTYAYINDDFGVHKVGNESTHRAISLHVYAPGWSSVQIYAEDPTDAGGAPINTECWGDF